MIKAVIFDYDGVIVDNRKAHSKAWKILFAKYGVEITKYHLDNVTRGRSAKDIVRYFLNNRFSEARLKEIEDEKTALYHSLPESKIPPINGLIQFIEKLKAHKLLVAIATSSRRDALDLKMKRYNIDKYFDVIICSDHKNIRHAKPHPDIYLITAKALKVRPDECVVFEDAISGVKSAKAAGMKVVLIMTAHKKQEFKTGQIDLAIKDYGEIEVDDIMKL